jgi:hypothetical protein
MPIPPASLSDWLWLPRSLRDAFAGVDGTPAGPYTAALMAALAILGCVALYRTRPPAVFALLSMIAITVAASALRKYPFAHRLIFFLYPVLILLVCAGLGWLIRRPPAGRWAAGVLAVLVLGPPLAKAGYGLLTQPATQEVKPLLRMIGERYREGDLVWVDSSGGPAFDYYSRYAPWFPHAAFQNRCAEDCHRRMTSPAAYEEALAKAARSRRVWVFAVYIGAAQVEEERQLLQRLDAFGSRAERVELRGAALTLYDFGAAPLSAVAGDRALAYAPLPWSLSPARRRAE